MHKEEIARRNKDFKVRNLGPEPRLKGARDRPCRTMAKSHVGTLVQAAGLSLRVPWSKQDTKGFLPKDIPPKGMW